MNDYKEAARLIADAISERDCHCAFETLVPSVKLTIWRMAEEEYDNRQADRAEQAEDR